MIAPGLGSPVSISAGIDWNGNATTHSSFGPLVLGDIVNSVFLRVAGDAEGNPGDRVDVTVGLYLCNSAPASVAEARAGQLLVPEVVLHLDCSLVDASNNIIRGVLAIAFPLAFRVDQRFRWLALVGTVPAGFYTTGVQGVAFANVTRRFPDV
jgi:hypothetical protein